MQNKKIIIGIGGNLKSEEGAHPIKVAMNAISYFKDYSIKITNQSSWYETEPIPKSDQPNFFNCIVLANTTLNELDVLKSLHEIEHKLGRKRRMVNEARIIDLDLIDYSNKILKNKDIIIPHPRAHQRRLNEGTCWRTRAPPPWRSEAASTPHRCPRPSWCPPRE